MLLLTLEKSIVYNAYTDIILYYDVYVVVYYYSVLL